MIHFGFFTKGLDIEAASLYRGLEEEIYHWRDVTKDGCIILEMSICDLVQVGKQYNKKATLILKKECFNVDPCIC